MLCGKTGEWQGGEEGTFCQRDWDSDPFEGSCDTGDVICGFRAQVQADQVRNKAKSDSQFKSEIRPFLQGTNADDTTLNALEFICCPSEGKQICFRALF